MWPLALATVRGAGGRDTLPFPFTKRISTGFLHLFSSPPHRLWNTLLPLPTFHHDGLWNYLVGFWEGHCWGHQSHVGHRWEWVDPALIESDGSRQQGDRTVAQSTKCSVWAVQGLPKSTRDPHWKPVLGMHSMQQLSLSSWAVQPVSEQWTEYWKRDFLSVWWKLVRQTLHLTLQKIMFHCWKLLLFWSSGKNSRVVTLVYLIDELDVATIDRCFNEDSSTS